MRGDEVLADLLALRQDPDPTTRVIGGALQRAVLDGLDADERAWTARIESLRADMEVSSELVDTAFGTVRRPPKPMELAEICRRRSKKRPWGVFLLTLARALAPQQVLELGTCLGISAGYLAGGLALSSRGHLLTLEGSSALAERSRTNLGLLGVGNAEVVEGIFAETLDGVLERAPRIGLAFIDGHHQEKPTLRYFARLKTEMTAPAVVVFDDIRWSEDMEAAWAVVQQDPCVRAVLDLDSVGLCVVGEPTDGPARVHVLPTVTRMQAALAARR